jgi:hypothetical protein
MRRELAHFGGTGRLERPVRSIACLAFVALMASAFWAGAVYIGEMFFTAGGPAF